MNKLILIAVALLFLISANAQKATDRDNVINLLKQFDTAIAKKDSITLGKFLTNDFIGSIANGQSFNKNSYISFVCGIHSKTREFKEESTAQWNIKISNNCAIINRTVTYLFKTSGKKEPSEIKVKKLEVCLKVKGKWMLASLQATEVLKN